MPQMPAEAELLKQHLQTTVDDNTSYKQWQGRRAENGRVYCRGKGDPKYDGAEGSKIRTNPAEADWLHQLQIGGNTSTP